MAVSILLCASEVFSTSLMSVEFDLRNSVPAKSALSSLYCHPTTRSSLGSGRSSPPTGFCAVDSHGATQGQHTQVSKCAGS